MAPLKAASRSALLRTALAAFVVPAVLAQPIAAQRVPPGVHLEPPRAAGITLPEGALEAMLAGQPSLGIPGEASFLAATRSIVREGRLSLLVIPALFSDSEQPAVPTEEMQRVYFDGPSPGGTMGEFYRAASQGRFDVGGTVTPWVRTEVTMLEAAGMEEGHGWIGPRMRDHIAQAIHLADETIDFGQFDNDGPDGIPNSGDDDGFIDGLVVMSTEVAGSCGGPAPWPHFGGARENDTYVNTDDLTPAGQRILVQAYITDSVVECDATPRVGNGVLAHETGHLIGLPDLYQRVTGTEREKRAWAVGCFDLMAAGAWGCGTGPRPAGFGPTLFSPLMKWRLGWIEWIDVEVADRQEFVLEPAQAATTALRVRLSPGSSEYFLLEYRPATGFDADLPAGGVLVYHHDTFTGIRPVPSSEPRPYGYHLVEADGDAALLRTELEGGNRGAASDVFARNGSVDSVDGTTVPSTRDHAGGTTTLTIHSIRVAGGIARVTLSVGTGPHVAARQLPETVSATGTVEGLVHLAGGTGPWTASLVAGGLPAGVSASIAGDALRLSGTALQAGTFAATWHLTDASDHTISTSVRLIVGDIAIAPNLLVRGLAGGAALTADTRAYLDASGNANGRYDVGDMRAYLVRTGELR